MATHRNPYHADKDWRAAVEALVVPQPGREANTPPLLKWSALPAWQKDNQYILAHYRPASFSYSNSVQSIFYLHNESVNIHSHLLGSFLFLCLSFSVYAFREYPVSSSDIVAFGCFFFGAVICLGMSATYHILSNHSPSVNKFSNQLDYVGIVALITGSFIPSIYYGFFCEPALQRLYWGMVSIQAVHASPKTHWRAQILSIGTCCTVVSIDSKFRTPKWRTFRAAMFVAMGLSAVFPVIHGLILHGFASMDRRIGLTWLVVQGILYVAGAGLYAVGIPQLLFVLMQYWTTDVKQARVPECLNPGKYDLYGSSHQIFHVLIILAAMSHLMSLLTAFEHVQMATECI